MTGPYKYTGVRDELDQEAAWDYINDGYLPCPRTVLKGRTKHPLPVLPTISASPEKFPLFLQQALELDMGKIAGLPRAVMFSGGFDSMLIACLAKNAGAKVTGVTVQFEDFNPRTVAGSIEFAHKVGITHHILHVKAVEFLSAFQKLAALTDEPILDLDLAVVYAALKKYDLKKAGNVFISGMGSDQWFGDMALKPTPGGHEALLDQTLVDVEAHHQVAEAHGCKFCFPFLSRSMLALSQIVPADMKKDKKLLRSLAVADTIPRQGARSEVQVPALMRRILIKKYGDKAWPSRVSAGINSSGSEKVLRQIVLGLWLKESRHVRLKHSRCRN